MKDRICIFFLRVCFVCILASCSWVNDDLSDCPKGCWLKLEYTYNMLHVDAASTCVKDASVFIFDDRGKYVGKKEVDSLTFHQNERMINIDLAPGNYSFLVWAGLADVSYSVDELVVGVSDIREVGLALERDLENKHGRYLENLYYGRLDAQNVSEDYKVLVVPLMQDCKRLVCMLQDNTNKFLDMADFSFMLTARNGVIDSRNAPVDTVVTSYVPHTVGHVGIAVPVFNGGLANTTRGVRVEMNTLRLMTDDAAILSLQHLPSGQEIVNIPLSRYLLHARQLSGNYVMGEQEYLDRQHDYMLLFFLTPTTNPSQPYLCLEVKIGDWVIRMNEVEL